MLHRDIVSSRWVSIGHHVLGNLSIADNVNHARTIGAAGGASICRDGFDGVDVWTPKVCCIISITVFTNPTVPYRTSNVIQSRAGLISWYHTFPQQASRLSSHYCVLKEL